MNVFIKKCYITIFFSLIVFASVPSREIEPFLNNNNPSCLLILSSLMTFKIIGCNFFLHFLY